MSRNKAILATLLVLAVLAAAFVFYDDLAAPYPPEPPKDLEQSESSVPQ